MCVCRVFTESGWGWGAGGGDLATPALKSSLYGSVPSFRTGDPGRANKIEGVSMSLVFLVGFQGRNLLAREQRSQELSGRFQSLERRCSFGTRRALPSTVGSVAGGGGAAGFRFLLVPPCANHALVFVHCCLPSTCSVHGCVLGAVTLSRSRNNPVSGFRLVLQMHSLRAEQVQGHGHPPLSGRSPCL